MLVWQRAVYGQLRPLGDPGHRLRLDGTWAAAGAKDDIFWENNTTVSDDYTLTGKNAVSAGPITVADTKTVTVADGYVWVIV